MLQIWTLEFVVEVEATEWNVDSMMELMLSLCHYTLTNKGDLFKVKELTKTHKLEGRRLSYRNVPDESDSDEEVELSKRWKLFLFGYKHIIYKNKAYISKRIPELLLEHDEPPTATHFSHQMESLEMVEQMMADLMETFCQVH